MDGAAADGLRAASAAAVAAAVARIQLRQVRDWSGAGATGDGDGGGARAWRRGHNSDEQDDSGDDGAGRPWWGGSEPGTVARRNVRGGGHRAHRGGGGGAQERCRPGGHRAPYSCCQLPEPPRGRRGHGWRQVQEEEGAVSRRTWSGRGPVSEEEELQSLFRIMARSTPERSRPVRRRALGRASYCSKVHRPPQPPLRAPTR
uniref:Uncharacterized protein n=1 Tax=Oryza sativa subsp. japonica TaxID=39947 RepID=Q5Z8T6_ORYSJ|nr:hypothetical protein [Oryza sativa Japonica Group]BAD53818.1 hypothetical protein [Oryza sativa Japonica Group]